MLPSELTLRAIATELDILKLKFEYIAHNPGFIDERQEMNYYLNTVLRDLNVVNRGLPPLPKEMEIFDCECQQLNRFDSMN